MRESYLDLDHINNEAKIEVRLFGETFYLTLDQIKKLYIDPIVNWDHNRFARRVVEKITTASVPFFTVMLFMSSNPYT